MLHRHFVAVPVVSAMLFAACGGKVADAPVSSETQGSPADTAKLPGPPPPAPPAEPTKPVPPPPPPQPGPIPNGPTTGCGLLEGDRDQVLAAFGRARSLGIYEVVAVVEECSGAGGLHMTLQRRSGCGATKNVHFGQHTCMSETTWSVGDRAVLGVAPDPGSLSAPGWCLEEIAPWDGVARAMRKLAPGESDAQALARYGCVP